MEFGIDKSMLLNASFGYAYYRIVYDKQDVPFDYEFLEVNFAFEKLTGLKGSEIIGKTVCEVFPNILDPKFDFLLHYKSVALNLINS